MLERNKDLHHGTTHHAVALIRLRVVNLPHHCSQDGQHISWTALYGWGREFEGLVLCALNAAVDDVPGPSGYVGVGIEKTLSSTIKLQDVEGNFWKSIAKAHLATSIGSQSKCGFTGLSWFFKTEALADLRHDEDEMNRRFKRYAKEFNVSTVRDVGVYTVCFCVFHVAVSSKHNFSPNQNGCCTMPTESCEFVRGFPSSQDRHQSFHPHRAYAVGCVLHSS